MASRYKWVRDWLDGTFGTFPLPDCHQLPADNCQDFEKGGVASPLSCTGPDGQPGRPYRDTEIDTVTGDVVSTATGCYVPGVGDTSTPGTGSGPAPPPPPPTAGDVLQATNLPKLPFKLSPSGTDCSVGGAVALPDGAAAPCAPGQAPGLTGLPTLLAVNPPPPAQVTVTASIRGYTVTTQAHPVRYDWAMREDGDPPSTRNPNPTFSTDGPGTPDSPAAEYRWETKGDYHVSLTVVWAGSYTYSGFGVSRTESLGPVSGQPFTVAYHVVEVRAVAAAAP